MKPVDESMVSFGCHFKVNTSPRWGECLTVCPITVRDNSSAVNISPQMNVDNIQLTVSLYYWVTENYWRSTMKFRYCLVTLLALTVSTTAMAFTNNPNVFNNGNLWSITFHNDDSTAHTQWATQRICFLPYISPAYLWSNAFFVRILWTHWYRYALRRIEKKYKMIKLYPWGEKKFIRES